MILTRAWLSEWINLQDITSEDICSTLNTIGLEVDSLKKIRVPKNIVVGKILTCEKHPNADKLNVCEVDLGSETKQIVCGAKNVIKGQHVVVSKVGAILPSGMEIKKAKLRGVDSNGMICSSSELGLPIMGDGIMILDDSIGTLVLGREFSEYELINDDIIEIELTPNRGDCLSIYGVARDLSVPYDLDLKEFNSKDDDKQLGIGRVLNVSANDKVDSSLLYRVYDKKEMKSSLLIDFRLAIVEAYKPTSLQRVIEYAVYTTGTLLRAYSHTSFESQNNKATINIKKHNNGLNAVYNQNDEVISFVGVLQNEESKVKEEDMMVILEANYTHPEIISVNSTDKKLNFDSHLYRSSRGSEPNLDFGMSYLIELLKKYSDITLYAKDQQVSQDNDDVIISINLDILTDIIGEKIKQDKIIQILKRLGFKVVFKGEQSVMHVIVPPYRHDIVNIQDICEEIIRIIGIDNITSKPTIFTEQYQMNDSYHNFQKCKMYRHRAVGVGYFETVHFVFDHQKRAKKYGLKTVYKTRNLTNPITNELDTLRSSLIPNLLESVSKNIKFGKKSIKLFEVGTVFNQNREERKDIAFVFSGEVESHKVSNHGKPKEVDFFKFAESISKVVGSFELETYTNKNNLTSPYECARVILNGSDIGYISRVHLGVEKELNLYRTYICELSMNALSYERKEAKFYSKFPESVRDLSLMVSKNIIFSELKKYLYSIAPKELVKLYPIDIYEDESFDKCISLTLKFHFQSDEKTLEDKEIIDIIGKILKSLKKKFGITVR